MSQQKYIGQGRSPGHHIGCRHEQLGQADDGMPALRNQPYLASTPTPCSGILTLKPACADILIYDAQYLEEYEARPPRGWKHRHWRGAWVGEWRQRIDSLPSRSRHTDDVVDKVVRDARIYHLKGQAAPRGKETLL